MNTYLIQNIYRYLIYGVALLTALPFHEFAHAWTANKLGDPTARYQGRLTLNPLRHLDPIGSILMIVCGIGWARPVPINPYNFQNPKVGMAISSLAGPVSNLLLALWLLLGARLMYTHALSTGQLNETLFYFFMNTAMMSIGLGVFNLIPIPPLDGSKVLAAVLPDRQYNWLMRYERFGMLIIMALVCFGALSNVLNTAIGAVFQLFCRIVGFY